MTNLEKAKTLTSKDETKKFCRNLFEGGRNWLDVETLLSHVKSPHKKLVYQWYEEWQTE